VDIFFHTHANNIQLRKNICKKKVERRPSYIGKKSFGADLERPVVNWVCGMFCPSTKEKASVRVAQARARRRHSPAMGLRVAGVLRVGLPSATGNGEGVAGAGAIIYIYHLLAL